MNSNKRVYKMRIATRKLIKGEITPKEHKEIIKELTQIQPKLPLKKG